MARQALELLEVDPLGLDALDLKVLETIAVKFDGGPVGLETLAASLGKKASPSRMSASPS